MKTLKLIIVCIVMISFHSCSTGWQQNPPSHQDSINQGLIKDTTIVKVDTTAFLNHSQIPN